MNIVKQLENNRVLRPFLHFRFVTTLLYKKTRNFGLSRFEYSKLMENGATPFMINPTYSVFALKNCFELLELKVYFQKTLRSSFETLGIILTDADS